MEELEAAILKIVIAAAKAGERCPTMDGFRFHLGKAGVKGDGGRAITEMARKGFVKIEVGSLNWRVVEIRMPGEHFGLRTKENPRGGKPYVVIDKTGRHEPLRRWVS